MGILEVLESTLRVLDLVEVRGKDNRRALTVAVDNLGVIAKALKAAQNKQENDGEAKEAAKNGENGHDQQG